nr:MAG TPA: hypothetical protein [Caudoviricetes sp.]
MMIITYQVITGNYSFFSSSYFMILIVPFRNCVPILI